MAASTFLFHPLMSEVVPYNASYEFPSQSTRSTKRTIKMNPKNNAQSYISGSTIRFEFPASGYLNPSKTYLSFNCRSRITQGSFTEGADRLSLQTLVSGQSAGTQIYQRATGGFEFQQNIASIFRRVRVLYGSLVLEDIQDYNILQRMFTDILLSTGASTSDNLIHQGIGISNRLFGGTLQSYNDRFNYHSLETDGNATATLAEVGTVARRYAIPINTGVFQQKRLIPLKFMSSQLSIELELAEAADCQTWIAGTSTVGGTTTVQPRPTACVTEVGLVELNAELLEFDSEFDRAVFTGLSRGLAIPFQSWHMTSQNIPAATLHTINVQESARSVRYAIAGLTDDRYRTIFADAHVFLPGLAQTSAGNTPFNGIWLGNSGSATATTGPFGPGGILGNPTTLTAGYWWDDRWYTTTIESTLNSYQWRLGGVYYPSQPVPVYGGPTPVVAATAIDANYADPPVEAYCELQKIYDNQFTKAQTVGDITFGQYGDKRNNAGGTTTFQSTNFLIGVDFMTDRGDVIGGINAEEQNDMQLILRFNSAAGGAPKVVRIAVCYDNIMILGESNNMVLVN